MDISDRNQFQLQAHTDAIQSATESLVTALNRAHSFVWTLQDAELVELLNGMTPQNVAALMGNHYVLATAANTALQAAGSGSRANATAGREISYDGTAWTVTAIPQPEPEASE